MSLFIIRLSAVVKYYNVSVGVVQYGIWIHGKLHVHCLFLIFTLVVSCIFKPSSDLNNS